MSNQKDTPSFDCKERVAYDMALKIAARESSDTDTKHDREYFLNLVYSCLYVLNGGHPSNVGK